MALRSLNHWRNMMSRLGQNSSRTSYATSTVPKMKPNEAHVYHQPETKSRPTMISHMVAYMPVYVALGMVTLSVSFGIHTLTQQLGRAPNVIVKKSRRKTLPEVEDPETVLKDSERFLSKSWFRQLGHIQDYNRHDAIPSPISGDAFATRDRANARTVTLKDVGVDPKTRTT